MSDEFITGSDDFSINDRNVKRGIRDAMDFWLSQHDVSTPEIIRVAVREAVNSWLESHSDELIAAIAKRQ